MVKGICGKCNKEQELSIKKTGKRENDWCYWCPYCEDGIDRTAVIIK